MTEATQTAPPLVVGSTTLLGATAQTNAGLRYATVLQKRREGQTLVKIAAERGVTRERVRQMVAAAERREHALLNAPQSPLALLSVRAQNCILAVECIGDVPTPQEIRACMDSGRLKKIPNMGKKSIQEVVDWLVSIGA